MEDLKRFKHACNTLGVEPDDMLKDGYMVELKPKYREAIRKTHPDLGGNPDSAVDITTAYRDIKEYCKMRGFSDNSTICEHCLGEGVVNKLVRGKIVQAKCECNDD